ncbi:2-keto-4-pentenoate hydratase/2-oxohepta-3-ene-1,7-dioic acid hydratase in catechol pathway [Streptomyces sp. 3330]|uniref:fumarylacetoacetate hydrolase family protein n=1 Tax=Streptomyces sp. 3330 TaxID=2817755 RepID=UPI00285B1B3B|nr:fumarylacetoacetate hydrolase family protein [Streptomyces sp. 3330]MDR6979160.1 2-keto-4-pentenoate hydratase/2-oxohepta-3-ene-1,7-dioic acid hydratase in catechol pathway [Streptomyces sp. 3330]
MKLLRAGPPEEERPAVRAHDGRLLDLSPVTPEIDGLFLSSGGADRARAAAGAGGLPEVDAEGLRVGAPVARPGKIVCVGLNHPDHAAETGAAIPGRPLVFMKDPGTVVGPCDEVPMPRGSRYTVLEPGDGIDTGTHAGVALGLPGTPYLRPGDTVEPEIDGLGGLGGRRQTFGQA